MKLDDGDWLVSNSSAAKGRQLIYAMRISESIDFDQYYRDVRFVGKRADGRTWQGRGGDNIYFRNNAGEWEQARAFQHAEPGYLEKDTRHPRVFISDHFFYFGENAVTAPARFMSLLQVLTGLPLCPGYFLVAGF